MSPRLAVRVERWPIHGVFRTAKVERRETTVVVVEVSEGSHRGLGECVPYDGYGETTESVLEQLEGSGAPQALVLVLPPGAARNGLELALLDLECKREGVRIHELLERPAFEGCRTAYTLGIDRASALGRRAAERSAFGTLKIKARPADAERFAEAVRAGAPGAALVIDGNESWTRADLEQRAPALAELGVVAIEQPLPRDRDEALRRGQTAVPVYADESCHSVSDVHRLADRYDGVNVKLGKTGGLKTALAVADAARAEGLRLMVGCAVSTSLAIAPALLLTAHADLVDLDGPLLLARDRDARLRYEGDHIHPFGPDVWG